MTLPQETLGPPVDVRRLLPEGRWFDVAVPDAVELGEIELEVQVRDAYVQLRKYVTSSDTPHVVRLWNFIPNILAETTTGRDRYMAFNAGRYAALSDWFGGSEHLVNNAPAASGVGTDERQLRIHALALPRAGRISQNPLQMPPVQYSSRFGPRPPCFARAVLCGNVLLVSGTAAIVGEDSVFAGNLERQLQATLDNLRALLRSNFEIETRREALADFRSIRVYYPRSCDGYALRELCAAAFPHAGPIEFVNVDLCRRELLVEIEGVALERSGHG